jgi:glycerate kinase
MKVVIAIDSFKGSMTSLEAGGAVKDALLRVDPNAEAKVLPLADGGEGTVAAMCAGLGGEMVEAEVTGPLGERVTAKYCIVNGSTAVIEMAEAAGLPLVPPEMRDPMFTTTYGVGELVLDALERGFRKIMITVGGSGTNDGGSGMLEALGAEFFDADGNILSMCGGALAKLDRIDISNDAVIANARQLSSVNLALDKVMEAKDALDFGETPDIICFSLENALAELDMIDARATSEEIVSEIFSRFCVGK